MKAIARFLITFSLGLGSARADAISTTDNQNRQDWRMDRALALYIVKHAELAHQKISALNASAALKASKTAAAIAREIDVDLRRDLLEPIYGRFPDLRGQDVRTLEVAPVKALGPIDTATAQRIEQSVEHADAHWRLLSAAVRTVPLTLDDVRNVEDILAEIGFITAPGEKQHPALFEARMARIKAPADARTPKSDAAMRERAVPARDIKLAPVARTAIAAFARELRRQGDYVIAVMWNQGGASRGPDDKDWKQSPPGLDVGGYERSQLPPDLIGTLDGVAIVFLDDRPPRMRGRTIDYKDRHFRLRD